MDAYNVSMLCPNASTLQDKAIGANMCGIVTKEANCHSR